MVRKKRLMRLDAKSLWMRRMADRIANMKGGKMSFNTKIEPKDIFVKLADLYRQATTEQSHYYTAACVKEAMEEIASLRLRIGRLIKAVDLLPDRITADFLEQIIRQKEEERMSGGIAASPKRENLAYRLDGTSGTTNTLANEIAKTANAIREALMGCPSSAIAKDKEATDRAAPLPGFLGNMIARSEDNNRVLNYALDELRIVLGEIS